MILRQGWVQLRYFGELPILYELSLVQQVKSTEAVDEALNLDDIVAGFVQRQAVGLEAHTS